MMTERNSGEPPSVGQSQSEPALLSIREVHRSFGGVHAVDGASFEVRGSGITGLIGPNGAGKSTVMSVIAGAQKASGGSIIFDGQDITGRPAHKVARLGLIRTFQLSSEFSRLTVLENLLVAAPNQIGESLQGVLLGKRSWGAQERELVGRARDLLGRFGLADKESEYAGNLSGGQKRLVEIMRGLMAEPKLLLLDEPMAGVHPRLVGKIAHYLEQLRDEGLTMLMTEHELGTVDRLCDPVVVMAQGKVIAQGSMRQLRQQKEVVDAYLVS